MCKWAKYIFSLSYLTLLLFIKSASYGQFFRYSEAPIELDASFSRHSLEAYAGSTFFNALFIKNQSNKSEIFTLHITVPQGWNIIGPSKIELTVNPYDSLIIPLRVAVAAKVKGDIGYSVIASLSDSRGNTIKNEYCFVKIPRVSELSVRYISRVSYIDPVSNTSEVSVLIRNKGNREELVNLFFDGNGQLNLGEKKLSKYSDDLVIPPYTDTTLYYPVELRDVETFGKNMFGLKTKVTSIDTVYQSTLWFKKLETSFVNPIPYMYKPLVIEVVGQGLVDSERKPIVSAIIEGRTLFDNNSEVYYYYRNFSSRQLEDLYNRTKMYAGGVIGNWKFEIGDNYRNFQSSMYGRGGYMAYQNSKYLIELAVNKNNKAKIDNYGGAFTYRFSRSTSFLTGVTYHQNNLFSYDSKLAYLGSSFAINKVHRIYALGAFNIVNRLLDGKSKRNEFGGELNYTSRIGKLNNNLRVKYGSPLYVGIHSGRLNIDANSVWTINQKNRINFMFYESKYNRYNIESTSIVSSTSSSNRTGLTEYTFSPDLKTQIFIGASVNNSQFNTGNLDINRETFSSINYKLILGARFRNSIGTTSISPKVEIARANILNNPYSELYPSSVNRENINWQYFSLNFRSRDFNILAFYTSGPRSVLDQLNYSIYNRNTRKLQFMPTYNKFFFKDIMNLNIGMSYSNDIISHSTYTNLTGQVYWYLPKYWRIHFFTVYSIQSRENIQQVVENYQNLYIEAGVRKEFNIQQPRVKYYDISLVFFKDFNGNMIQEENEPGIRNVYVSLEKIKSDVKGQIPGDFNTIDLLSDNYGRVYLEQIPEGIYKVSYNPIGKEAGTFSKALEDFEINIKSSGPYYFPFVEKNKVFGKVILNRSKLSGLGRIDVSNVRITATDSQGRSYTSLTDKNGEFILFAPVTDEYILNINNIYYENFDLRQNNFLVQFNGYKQFEVNFVFDEKVRRINFAVTPEGEGITGVQQVRRTNISGTIKDANSQNPVRARVNLVNTRTNSIVTSTFSSATSGEYTLSFMSGDNYLLEVVADDYWYLSENLVLNQVTTFMSITRDVLLRPIAVGSKIELNIKFGPNSDFLAPESVAEMNRLLRLVRQNVSVKLEVQGHCDDIEALQRPEIALDRARAVAKYLIENGVSNIEVKSLGNTVPISANDTEEGRSRNRRVEVEVVSK